MQAPSLEERMDNLEKVVEPLRELPGRVTNVELQIVHLRTEMRGEFSSIRRDMATKEDLAGFATKEDLSTLADQMRMLHEDLVGRLQVLGEAWSSPRPSRRPKTTP